MRALRAFFIVLFVGSISACSKSGTSEDPSCKASCECKTLGWCGKNERGPDQKCAPRSEADCKASEICAETGACTLRGARCVVASDADCAGSGLCKTLGACTFVDDHCKALTPPPVRPVHSGVITPKP